MSFVLFNVILLGIIVFLFLLLSAVWPPDSPWAPWWRTSKKIARIMCKLAKVSKKDIVYDLGCGDGTALSIAAKEFGSQGIGIEIDQLRFLIARLRIKFNGLSKNVKIVRNNFFKEDFSDATVIFVTLVPKALHRLMPEFKQELKPGTRIVSYVYKMDLPILAEDKKNEVYAYRFAKK